VPDGALPVSIELSALEVSVADPMMNSFTPSFKPEFSSCEVQTAVHRHDTAIHLSAQPPDFTGILIVVLTPVPLIYPTIAAQAAHSHEGEI
jgi:hypothetical protein